MKRKGGDLDLDVRLAKMKQTFDVALRKFHAFSNDWNESKAFQLVYQLSADFVTIANNTIASLRVILGSNHEIELEALQILDKITQEINHNTIISHTTQKLFIQMETHVEPKIAGKLNSV